MYTYIPGVNILETPMCDIETSKIWRGPERLELLSQWSRELGWKNEKTTRQKRSSAPSHTSLSKRVCVYVCVCVCVHPSLHNSVSICTTWLIDVAFITSWELI